MGRFLEWGTVDSKGTTGGIVVFWDNRVLELIELEKGEHSISCHFKNCEDGFMWTFTRDTWFDHVERQGMFME